MALPDNWKRELLSKNDLASVASDYVQLTPRGGRLWACCPFHHEKTASFNISPDTQLYYCFGCHAGGGVIDFVMAMERLSYFEAVKFLADRVGMELPDDTNDEQVRAQRHMRERLHSACRAAAMFYHKNLITNESALSYLYNRGVSPSMIKRFGLGYSLDSWDALYEHLKAHDERFTDDELIQAGLARRKTQDARPYDSFRNRIMFPIISERGSVLGFGARTMGNEKPKYINTNETPIFNKRYNLYGLNLCKRGALSDIIIVEGYMDVISLHAAGIQNVVASLGTALTEQQARLIKRYTENVYIAYDGDSAGQHATLRGMEILAHEGLNVRVISIPDDLDPDEYARAYGEQGFFELKNRSEPLNSHKITALAQEFDLTSEDARQSFVIAACGKIAEMQPVERDRYFDMVARISGYPLSTVREQAMAAKPGNENSFSKIRHNTRNKSPFAKNEREKHELMLASCAALSVDAAKYVSAYAKPFIKNPAVIEFLTLLESAYSVSEHADIPSLLSGMETEDGARFIAAALNEQAVEKPLPAARDCTAGLKRMHYKEQLMELSAMLDNREITPEEYMKRYKAINEELKKLD